MKRSEDKTYLYNSNVSLVGPLRNLDCLSDQLAVTSDIASASAAPTSESSAAAPASALAGMSGAGEPGRHKAGQTSCRGAATA